ncbi:RCC1 and BTB domain-containing protein 2-like [Cloeon dipterum]|uniref:RCC1 and BTB domain-containing protein 2-like n=1 Tax=Cloeon dipterum TaxID=197152 RepID=UPI0032204CF2
MSKLLANWGYFGYQKSEIRTALGVFGALSGGEVIIVLENDEVLAFGGNHKGCLGVGNEREVKALKRIESLCGQEIQGFECSVYTGNEGDEICLFAISGSGSVFSWGHNEDGQLGLGTTIYTKVPTKISSSLEQKRVVQVACSGDHTLALTSEGEVYAFGVNGLGQLGLGSTVHHFLLPQRVGGLLDGKIVTSVACQNIASFALLQSGEMKFSNY